MNTTQENHARQALEDVLAAAKERHAQSKDAIMTLGEYHWLGELMAKISTVLEADFRKQGPKCRFCLDRGGWEDGDEGQWVTCSCEMGKALLGPKK